MNITLATLPGATEQEVFDQVKNHLLKQNKKSVSDCTCMYRSADGMKCAAGCLIGDYEYSAKLENKNWKILSEQNIVPENHFMLIVQLQAIHDSFRTSCWPVELRKVADKFKLNYNLEKKA